MPISLSARNQLSLKTVPSVSEVTAWWGSEGDLGTSAIGTQDGTYPHHFGAF